MEIAWSRDVCFDGRVFERTVQPKVVPGASEGYQVAFDDAAGDCRKVKLAQQLDFRLNRRHLLASEEGTLVVLQQLQEVHNRTDSLRKLYITDVEH